MSSLAPWLLGSSLLLAACSSEDVLQGGAYEPDGTLAPAAPRERPVCDGGCGDAGTVVVPPLDNEPKNTCESARDIGSLNADTLSPSLTTQGTCAEWLKLRATEGENGVFGTPSKLKVRISAPGDAFVVFAFMNPDRDVLSCTSPIAETKSDNVLTLQWGEGTVANGADDSRTVSLLVAHPSGPCGASTWSVFVDGNL